MNEAKLIIEDLRVITVKPDNEAGVNIQSRLLDAFELGTERIASHVLELFGFGQRCLPRSLDSDEHATEIGSIHQIQKIRIIGQINAGFSGQAERVIVLFHPRNELFQQCLGFAFIADKVVIHDKRGMESGSPHFVQFRHELFRLLHAWAAAIDNDNVAELTLKRTTA